MLAGLPYQQSRPYGTYQFWPIDMFREQVAGAKADRLDGIVEPCMAAYEYHLRPFVVGQPAEALGKLQAGQFGHTQIGNHNFCAISLCQKLQGQPSIGCRETGQASLG
ncbi:MAG: hypothetical protein ABS35_21705 [Kaistia sp. SCN 65-12]|nr:MAG: hypothetical protein ABS35_21705 [Kaistia sp. SCN 65-12]